MPSRISLIWLLLTSIAAGSATWGGTADRLPAAGSPAKGELVGSVTDTEGAPLAGVTVEARWRGMPLGAAGTDARGEFRLVFSRSVAGNEPIDEVLVTARRLGYHPVERTARPDDGPLTLVMTTAPLPLPGLRVEGEAERCERDDADGRGRALWRTAAARHPGGLDTLGVATYMRARVDTLSLEEGLRDRGKADGASAAPGQRGSAPILRIGWARRVDRQGYAFPVRRTDRSGSYPSWSYAPLEAGFAPHFGTAQFGDRHYFQVVSEGMEGWTLRFCPRDTGDPYLEGRLEMDPDTLLRRIEWRFRTSEPDEEAGGWAVFPPAGPDGEPPRLLPVESITWQTLHGARTIRRAQWFEGWILAPGDSVPFLPRR